MEGKEDKEDFLKAVGSIGGVVCRVGGWCLKGVLFSLEEGASFVNQSLTWRMVRGRLYVQWNLSIKDTAGTQLAVLYTVEPLHRGHCWDPAGCPV